MTRCATRWVLGLFLFSAALAHADSVISNGNFQQGLTNWNTLTTANGTVGPFNPQIVPFSPDGVNTYNAAQLQVGQSVATTPVDEEGGGIFQNVLFTGAPVQISADIAVKGGTTANLNGGFAELLIDMQPVLGYDFGALQAGEIKTSTFTWQEIAPAGTHSIGIEFLRPATQDATTPYQYVYNVDGFTADEVPEPSTIMLIAAGLLLLARSRRRVARASRPAVSALQPTRNRLS